MGRFGLTLHPDKTRLLPFRRPPAGQQRRERSGAPSTSSGLRCTGGAPGGVAGGMACKTRRARLRRAIQAVDAWCRRHRHETGGAARRAQRVASRATSTTSGSTATCGVCLPLFQAERAWYKWLRRRSQQAQLTWERFGELLRRLPSPQPRIVVPHLGSSSHEPSPRKSRMVEISLSGSGEGPGRATGRGYSTRDCMRCVA